MNIKQNITELIGGTPLLRLKNIERELGLNATLLAKLECFNPAGSAKDRPALWMILDAEKRGALISGGTIIEPTSGNTGIGLAAVAASRGYRVILTMPDSMSVERQQLLKAYGAEVVLTDGKKGMAGAVEKANELLGQIEGSIIAGQFDNPANPLSHYETTGPEIWADTDGRLDIFVAGIGTGGTISGVGRYLKEKDPNVRIVGAEPLSSPLITKGQAGPHSIMGIGANFVPKNLNTEILDEVICVADEDAFEFGRLMAKKEGILVGISSGAALSAAVQLSKQPQNEGKTVVVLLPDTGERYLSTRMFN